MTLSLIVMKNALSLSLFSLSLSLSLSLSVSQTQIQAAIELLQIWLINFYLHI